MASIDHPPCLKLCKSNRSKLGKFRLLVDCGRVIHTVKIDEVRQIVDVESSGKSVNEIDKETVSFSKMQLVTPPFLHIAAEANLGYYFKASAEWSKQGAWCLSNFDQGLSKDVQKLIECFLEEFLGVIAHGKEFKQ
ncbi:hypothetical protein Tco_0318318 [Tanacetum coccineum]